MTTPGGVPNLPIGALTLDTLASKLEDMSGTAMKSRAVERFPSIFNTSTGLDPSLDTTPFGILTRIWGEVNSLVANADPADIQRPEDLPPLMLEFIEGLPVVGQFVGVLEAILGTYDGDDPVLLELQEIFTSIRVLLQLISGQGVGFPSVGSLTAGWQLISGQIANINSALQGINLTQPGSVLAAIGATSEAFAMAMIALLGNVPIIGGYMASLAGYLLTSVRNAVDAIATATATQQIVGAPPPTPTWHALVPGLAPFNLSEAGSETVTVTATVERYGFLKPQQAAEYKGISFFAYSTGTVTTVNVDVYKLDTSTGDLNYVGSSPDISSLIVGGSSLLQVPYNFAEGFSIISTDTDVFALGLRMTGSGSITIVAHSFPNVAAPAGYYPTKTGLVVNPTTTGVPPTIPAATVAGLYSNVVPYMQLALYTQNVDPSTGGSTGPTPPTVTLKKYYDGFNRNSSVFNSVRLGGDWVAEQNVTDNIVSQVAGYAAIVNDAVVFGPGVSGAYGIGRQGGLWKYAAVSDQFRVGANITANNVPSMYVGWANTGWSSWLGTAIYTNGAQVTVELRVGNSFGTYQVVKTVTFTPPSPNLLYWTEYDPETNVYRVYLDSGTTITTWQDSSNQVAHNANCRYAGVVVQTIGNTRSGPVDDFRLEELGLATGEPVPPTTSPVADTSIDFQELPNGAVTEPGWKASRITGNSTVPFVRSGAMVMDGTGSTAAAGYLTKPLSDNARIVWAQTGFSFTPGATQYTTVVVICLWVNNSFYTVDSNGFAQINGAGEFAPVHCPFDAGGYILQWYSTATGAVTVQNHRYPTPPAAGALHNVGVYVDVAASTCTVFGADGHIDVYYDTHFSSLVAKYACVEIYETNPSLNLDAFVYYFEADSVLGGRTPASALPGGGPNLAIDFTTKANGPLPVVFDTGQALASSYLGTFGVGSVLNARHVNLATSGQQATYVTGRCTDGAVMVWVKSQIQMATTSSNNSQNYILALWNYAMPAGQITLGGTLPTQTSPCHIAFFSTGYQIFTINIVGASTSFNLIYSRTYTSPPGGAVQSLEFTINRSAQTIAVTGGDGVTTTHGPNAALVASSPTYACAEIQYNDAALNNRITVLNFYADSVSGGRPTPSRITSSLKKVTAAVVAVLAGVISSVGATVAKATAAVGASLTESGTVFATTGKAAVVIAGQLVPSGSVVGSTQPVTASLGAVEVPAGAVSGAVLPATASAVGSVGAVQFGTVAATTAKATTLSAGEQAHLGTVAATTQKVTAAISGSQAQSGTVAGTTQKVTAAIVSAQAHLGTVSATTAKATAALTGTQSAAVDSDNFNVADGAITAGWTNQGSNLLRVLSNQAVPTSASSFAVMKRGTARSTAKAYVEITIATASSADIYLIYLGAKSGAQAIAIIQPNTSIQIITKTTAYTDVTFGAYTVQATASSSTVANGDVIRFEVDGTGKYTIKRNGTALTGCINIDLSAVVSTDGRDILLGMLAGAVTRGIDAFAAADF